MRSLGFITSIDEPIDLPKVIKAPPEWVRKTMLKKLNKRITDLEYERDHVEACLYDLNKDPKKTMRIVREAKYPDPPSEPFYHHVENDYCPPKTENRSAFAGLSHIMATVLATAAKSPPQRVHRAYDYHEIAPGYRPSVFGDVHRYGPSTSALGGLTSFIWRENDNRERSRGGSFGRDDSDDDTGPGTGGIGAPSAPLDSRGSGWGDSSRGSDSHLLGTSLFQGRWDRIPPIMGARECLCGGENCQNRFH